MGQIYLTRPVTLAKMRELEACRLSVRFTMNRRDRGSTKRVKVVLWLPGHRNIWLTMFKPDVLSANEA